MAIVEIKNLNRSLGQVSRRLRESGAGLTNDIDIVLFKGGNKIRTTMIESMVSGRRKQGPSGLLYPRGPGKFHIASASGEAPAVDSGELLRSLLFEVQNNKLETGVAGGAPYADDLELGTRNMDARPFLEPATEKHEEEIINNLGELTNDIFETAFKFQ